MFKNEFLKFQDKLYIIKRTLKEEFNPNVEAWRQHLGADLILRKEGILYFLETVPDLEIIITDSSFSEIK